jgi:hypothetical protein
MAHKVIHFGSDECHRSMVLRSAGYAVEDCTSLLQLRACLAPGAMADALVVSDTQDLRREAIDLARSRSSLPIVVFCGTNLAYEESGIDLIVHCLTRPEVWLEQVDAVIARSRAIREQSRASSAARINCAASPSSWSANRGRSASGRAKSATGLR